MVVMSFATLRRPPEKKDEGETTEEKMERIASPYASKMLNLLAYVLSQPSVKCAALQLMTQNRYADIQLMVKAFNIYCKRFFALHIHVFLSL